MATDYTRQWIQFFTGCGIPEDVATTYGLIFNENRIQKNMLLDLNKEYLRDMGITIMGDVIAILRHAKVVHDKYVRDQILSESEIAVENCATDNPGIKKTTPIKRMLEHYTRKYDTSELSTPHETVQIQIENENSILKIPQSAPHVGPQNKVTMKKRIEAPSVISGSLIPMKPVVPVPKVRRVLPENEGSYKIKMPSGTTERSKKILEKAKVKHNKTVFERLGESSVSSTSDITTVQSTTTQVIKSLASKDKNFSSVFARLGEKSSLVTSTSSNGDATGGDDQLPYRGILKAKAGKKKLGYLPGSTMRADNELQTSSVKDKTIKKINLKERLGTSTTTLHSSPPKESIKLNRLQITTTFEEEEIEPSEVKTLSTRFKSINPLSSEGKEKNASDCLDSFRSEAKHNKSRVSSTTQSPETKHRGVKRHLDNSEPVASEALDVVQSKKVRFGRTTQRLIPGNPTEFKGATKEYPNLTMVIGNGVTGGHKLDKLKLASGVKIGQMNSDRIPQKLSLKDRIGSGSLQFKSGRIATELKRKRSLKFTDRLKKNSVSIHDRLG